MNRLKLTCVVCLVCCSTILVRGNTIITNTDAGSLIFTNPPQNLGYDFTIGSQSIEITALGIWDQNQDGLASAHVVGLWDNSGNLLAKATISLGTIDPLVGEFRYSSTLILTNPGPLILSAGMTYVVAGAYMGNDPDPAKATIGATFDPAIISGNQRFSGGGFSFPSNSNGAGTILGPNAQFTVLSNGVPESGSSVVLLFLALIALLGISRSRLLTAPR